MAVHADNEDTKQRLAAAVRVRGFLVTRLAEVEAEVKAAKEDKERVLAQVRRFAALCFTSYAPLW